MTSGLGGFLQESRRLYFTPVRRRHRVKEPPGPADPMSPVKVASPKRSALSPLLKRGRGERVSEPETVKQKRPVTAIAKKDSKKVNTFKKVPSGKLVVGLPFEWAARLLEKNKINKADAKKA
ncbi:unnamed protein product [Durusdinium trenchii]|uniref:Uncharacterized protein n=1 Tax=Durusdinium trenchii TaxID=1381693 RepID=A0ABP0MU47_9DINO